MSDTYIGALLVGGLLLILNALDVHSTILFRSVGIPEGNEIFGPAFDKHPLWKAVVAKLVGSLVILWAIWYYRHHDQYLYPLIMAGLLLAIYYAYTVFDNYRAYLRHR